MSAADARPRKRRWRHLQRRVRNWIAGLIGPTVIWAWTRTLRIRSAGAVRTRGTMYFGEGAGIYVFWHQRMLVLAGIYRRSGTRVLISEHGDGELIARIIGRLGMKPIRGSSTRGGVRATLELLREVESDVNFAITPDGPRGPRHVFQEGAIYLASRTGLPIYPVTVACRRRWQLPTWDGFIVPLPFTATIVRFGEPLRFPADLSREQLEAARLEAERRLRDLTEDTDREFEALYAGASR
ncbi:MAG: lysophospholipid acyltransferase family protein [Planctomycetes bacterium]|nr:lysophospholipid acyltransferase family protein [Planctomycetota bacterium]